MLRFLCTEEYLSEDSESKDANGEGIWNSTNIANISGDHTKSITYKVTSSVIYQINSLETESEPYSISGNLRRSVPSPSLRKTKTRSSCKGKNSTKSTFP